MENDRHGGWRISARSTGSTSCVEVRTNGRQVMVRNSNDVDGPVLTVETAAWLAFRAAVATGRVDHGVLTAPVMVQPFVVGLDAVGQIELAEASAGGPGVVVRYTKLEWDTFVAGVTLDGEFTMDWLLPTATGV